MNLPEIINELLAIEAEAMETGGAVDYADVTHKFAALRNPLKAAWADQGQLVPVIQHFAKVQAAQDPGLKPYLEAEVFDDELEDGGGFASAGADDGAWVLAWKWVSDEKAGIEHCSECGALLDEAGDGYDGLCADCADKAEGAE